MDKLTTRTDRQLAGLLFALALGLYLRTLAPGLLEGDSGEFQFAAWRLGLAHPTGYPLYLLLGSAWQHGLALLGVNPATALNAFSALIGALTVALLYWVMCNWLTGDATLRRGVAALTALTFAINPTFWSQNLIAEVYTLHVFFILLIFYTTQRLALATNTDSVRRIPHSAFALSFLTGLALTHHGMTLWLLPGLLLTLWLVGGKCWCRPRLVLTMLAGGALPFLLYLYIPLRSGPAASPWYHQRLGTETLDLYTNNWAAFLNFISGRSISVGFYGIGPALNNVSQAWLLWRLHFTWIALLLAVGGLYTLIRQRRWPILALTFTYALLQQIFNLFYAIGDILVYYIPLYLMATIWFGFGVHALLAGIMGSENANYERNDRPLPIRRKGTVQERTMAPDGPAKVPAPNWLRRELRQKGGFGRGGSENRVLGLVVLTLFFALPLAALRQSYPALDQSAANSARLQWQTLLAAQLPANAVLISNDRNELVPLFYLQAVEGRATGMTALFPLIKPDPRFVDIGTTITTALAASAQPVYLIKPMPGLAVKFKLKPVVPPLVQVIGPAMSAPPAYAVNQAFGPLQLVGYDWQTVGDKVQIDLYWSVQAVLAADYTTTVQLFDAADTKLAQDDQPPGGVYYPTTLWKPGETLVDRHILTMPAAGTPATLLVGMYTGPTFAPLAAPLKIKLRR